MDGKGMTTLQLVEKINKLEPARLAQKEVWFMDKEGKTHAVTNVIFYQGVDSAGNPFDVVMLT